MMTMETMKRIAPKYGLACLLHEKPFAGVNGCGKHLNWRMGDDLGNNLLNPGDTPHDNMQFLVFCAAVLRAVNKWQGLLRASIASAGNDHRLGANEAPPAIISVFLGDMLTDIFEQIEKGGAQDARRRAACWTPACGVLPKLPRDAGRPQPHQPVRVHRQQVRVPRGVVGPEHRDAEHRLNVAVAECARLRRDRAREPPSKSGKKVEEAVEGLLPKMIKQHKRIIFNGNNYSDEWQKEAAKRGLLNLTNTVDALPELVKPDVIKPSRSTRCSTSASCTRATRSPSRQYNKTINIEAQLMVLMANRYILPAALKYQKRAWRRACRRSRPRARTAKQAQEAARRGRPADRRAEGADTLALQQQLEHGRAATPRSTRSTSATRSCRRWRRCARPATRSSCSSRTRSGRCRRTGRCCSSSNESVQTETFVVLDEKPGEAIVVQDVTRRPGRGAIVRGEQMFIVLTMHA